MNTLAFKIEDTAINLEKCREKCHPPAEPSQVAPAECPKIPFLPVIIGPKAQYGSGFSKTVQNTIGSPMGGMMGGSAGGGIMGGSGSKGMTGGGGPKPPEPSSEKPPMVKNPCDQMTKFSLPETDTAIKVGAKQTDKGLLIAAEIDKGKGKPTFNSMTLIRRDDCRMLRPSRYYLYELWLEWWLTVSWTKTTYVNNQMVSQEHGGWSAHGTELLDRGVFASNRGGEESIWRYFGFDRATEGPKGVIAEFAMGGTDTGSPQGLPPMQCVIHVTQPDKDPVTTVAFVFNVLKNPDGSIQLTQVPNALK
jgi:hypothetical protein